MKYKYEDYVEKKLEPFVWCESVGHYLFKGNIVDSLLDDLELLKNQLNSKSRAINQIFLLLGLDFLDEEFCEHDIIDEIARLRERDKLVEWYSIWHNKFKSQIDSLSSELETYRPTKLIGNGQCSCFRCESLNGFNRHWTSFCYRYKGHVYCSDCLEYILSSESENV